MDIETNMEQMANQQDAFLEGWEPADQQETETAEMDTVETVENVTEAVEKAVVEQAEETTEANTETAENAETAEADTASTTEDATAETPAVESWIVNYMGQQKTLTKADITPELLQKGMDYDRIRAKHDEAKPVMEIFTAFAEKANMSVMDYVKHLRAAAKQAEGLSEAEASRAIDLEDREAAVAAAEAERRDAAQEQEKQQAQVRADLELFGKLYPDVYEQMAKGNHSVIPQPVWDAVNKGELLLVAYKRYADAQTAQEKQQLIVRAAAAEQGVKNAARSTGSMKSAGNDTKNTDAFLEGWDN